MTSDFNATVLAIDEKMNAYEEYIAELSDISARIRFETGSLFCSVFEELAECEESVEQTELELARLVCNEEENGTSPHFEEEYDALSKKLFKLREKQTSLEELSRKCEGYGRSTSEEFLKISHRAISTSSNALAFMGRYIHDINLAANIKNGIYKSDTLYVCIVDSALHPESAEHIKTAIKCGQPSVLTLDRTGAAHRRHNSLCNIDARSEFDRDEYPLAIFSEGGDGANVFYLNPSDNRGSGSYIARQLRQVPNGSKVRIRII